MASKTSGKRAGRPARKYSQGERLLKLYDMLHRGQPVNARREAITFETSKRTIERDLECLREVQSERLERWEQPGVGVVYGLPYGRRKWNTTLWQVLAVVVGTRLTGFLSGRSFATEVEPLLEQFRGSLDPGKELRLRGLERKIHVVRTGQKDYRHDDEMQELLADMLKCLLTNKAVWVSYLSPKRRRQGLDPRKLLTHPLSIVLYRGAVYFVVEVVGGDWRDVPARINLALDRITDAEVTEEHFDDPVDFDPEEFFAGAFGIFTGEESYQVEIRIDDNYAPYVTERFWHESQKLVPEDEGGLVLRMELGRLEEVTDWILGMGEHVEVLAPEELRERVQERLEGALSIYRNRAAT